MKKDINVEIGGRIKEKRKEHKYTREALSELIDISPQFLAEIECGKKGMSFLTLKKLCQCLGVSCDYIIMGKLPCEGRSQLHELVDSMDSEYITVAENALSCILQAIAIAKKQ